jgi:GTP-binding protein YchF
MNIGIIGLPQTGKKILFELLVGHGPLERRKEPTQTVRGFADIQDSRFDRLVEIYTPKKSTRARLEILLPQRIEERSISQGDIFRDLIEVDVFCHVVRTFEDDTVYHVWGGIDPVRDIDFVNGEFILHDMIFVEKRLERIDKDLMKAKTDSAVRERDVLLRLKRHLEDELPLRVADLTKDEEDLIKTLPLLSGREMVVVLNVSDSDLGDRSRMQDLNERYAPSKIRFCRIAAGMEAEIAALETEAERMEFMREMGIEDRALHVVTRRCVEALGLVSFFTVAHDEVRQWFVRRGASAVTAAGKIHTDIARGFIRAEVIHFSDLHELGSEERVKSAGKLAVKGRDYIVEEGDILFIRFSVS